MTWIRAWLIIVDLLDRLLLISMMLSPALYYPQGIRLHKLFFAFINYEKSQIDFERTEFIWEPAAKS